MFRVAFIYLDYPDKKNLGNEVLKFTTFGLVVHCSSMAG